MGIRLIFISLLICSTNLYSQDPYDDYVYYSNPWDYYDLNEDALFDLVESSSHLLSVNGVGYYQIGDIVLIYDEFTGDIKFMSMSQINSSNHSYGTFYFYELGKNQPNFFKTFSIYCGEQNIDLISKSELPGYPVTDYEDVDIPFFPDLGKIDYLLGRERFSNNININYLDDIIYLDDIVEIISVMNDQYSLSNINQVLKNKINNVVPAQHPYVVTGDNISSCVLIFELNYIENLIKIARSKSYLARINNSVILKAEESSNQPKDVLTKQFEIFDDLFDSYVVTTPPRPTVPVEEPNDKIIEDEIDVEIFEDYYRIFTIAEVEMPRFLDEATAMRRKMAYPETAQEKGIQGRVSVQFIINEEGSVEILEVRGIGGVLEEYVLKVLQSTQFTPGMFRGRPVSVKLVESFNFKLQS